MAMTNAEMKGKKRSDTRGRKGSKKRSTAGFPSEMEDSNSHVQSPGFVSRLTSWIPKANANSTSNDRTIKEMEHRLNKQEAAHSIELVSVHNTYEEKSKELKDRYTESLRKIEEATEAWKREEDKKYKEIEARDAEYQEYIKRKKTEHEDQLKQVHDEFQTQQTNYQKSLKELEDNVAHGEQSRQKDINALRKTMKNAERNYKNEIEEIAADFNSRWQDEERKHKQELEERKEQLDLLLKQRTNDKKDAEEHVENLKLIIQQQQTKYEAELEKQKTQQKQKIKKHEEKYKQEMTEHQRNFEALRTERDEDNKRMGNEMQRIREEMKHQEDKHKQGLRDQMNEEERRYQEEKCENKKKYEILFAQMTTNNTKSEADRNEIKKKFEEQEREMDIEHKNRQQQLESKLLENNEHYQRERKKLENQNARLQRKFNAESSDVQRKLQYFQKGLLVFGVFLIILVCIVVLAFTVLFDVLDQKDPRARRLRLEQHMKKPIHLLTHGYKMFWKDSQLQYFLGLETDKGQPILKSLPPGRSASANQSDPLLNSQVLIALVAGFLILFLFVFVSRKFRGKAQQPKPSVEKTFKDPSELAE